MVETAENPNATAFLERFPRLQRGPMGNHFYDVVRRGVTDPDAIIQGVNAIADRQLKSLYLTDEKREVLLTLKDALLYDREAVGSFIAYVLEREAMTYEERQQHKAEKGRDHINNHMRGLAPTDAQLKYLTALGYTGGMPKNRLEASELIEEYRENSR